jgi:hypothetical protein
MLSVLLIAQARTIPADEAFNYAEEHLTAHLEQYAQRFELWHRIRSQ